jgi:GDPmannose 4,6-dehydratase
MTPMIDRPIFTHRLAGTERLDGAGQRSGRKALITGITAQDGSYLAELLLAEGYEVHGGVRRSSTFTTGRIHDLHERGVPLTLHYGDLSDSSSLLMILNRVRPDEVYNPGAMNHVAVSFDTPEYMADATALGNLRLLEALRHADWQVRFYPAGSSKMFGLVQEVQQRETSLFYPRSPYAVAKVFAHYLTVQYHGTFVTRKVTRGIASILTGKHDKLYLGNLEVQRDWGYAPEYVDAIWLMLQQEAPDDYVIATGEMHSVRELVEIAFGLLGIGWEEFVRVDPRYFWPAEVDQLLGDAGKAHRQLGWRPRTSLRELVRIMLEAHLRAAGLDPARYPDLVREEVAA